MCIDFPTQAQGVACDDFLGWARDQWPHVPYDTMRHAATQVSEHSEICTARY